LKSAEPRAGASGEEVQPDITDKESARIKGPHGYIQGYNGIAAADSGNQIIVSAEAAGKSERESFPTMPGRVEENMKKTTGKKKPLKGALVAGDTGFFSEENLREAKRRRIEAVIPGPQFRQRDPDFEEREKGKGKKRYTAEDFRHDKKNKRYVCPAGKILRHKGRVKLRNSEGEKYRAAAGGGGKRPRIGKCISMKNRNAKRRARTLYIAEKKYKENLSEKMREKIDNPAYRELYSRRQQIIGPVFSDIEYCKGMGRFTPRGREKVDIQWKLYCIVHNIGKCVRPLGKKNGA